MASRCKTSGAYTLIPVSVSKAAEHNTKALVFENLKYVQKLLDGYLLWLESYSLIYIKATTANVRGAQHLHNFFSTELLVNIFIALLQTHIYVKNLKYPDM